MNHRLIAAIAVAFAGACFAGASGMSFGGADNQTWVDSMGADVTLVTEPIDYYIPFTQSGSGYTGDANTTNNPPSGGTYFNTNSSAVVPTTGTAWEESGEGMYLLFHNLGSSVESVQLSWQGFVTATATASGLNASGFDYAQSSFEDANANSYPLITSCIAGSNGPTSVSASGSGSYTFYLAPGQGDEIVSLAYNQAYTTTTPEPFTLFLGGGAVLLAIRRRRRQVSLSPNA